jgi:hypothetical protein
VTWLLSSPGNELYDDCLDAEVDFQLGRGGRLSRGVTARDDAEGTGTGEAERKEEEEVDERQEGTGEGVNRLL